MTGSTHPLHEPASGETALLRAELRLEIAKLETRMTMWMAIYTMAAIAVGILWTMAFTLGREAWPWVGLFMLGTVAQLYWCVAHGQCDRSLGVGEPLVDSSGRARTV